MQNPSSTLSSIAPIPVKRGIVVLSGYEVTVNVERGHLCLRDGIASNRRASRFSKATCGIKRLVILGHSGTVSLEALKWLSNIKASVSQIDADGKIILASAPPGQDNVYLRRAQATAYNTETGLHIIKHLLRQKLSGQAEVLKIFSKDAEAERVANLSQSLDDVDEIKYLRQIESQAAWVYWAQWAELPLDFARSDAKKIPDHWRRFGTRISPLTNSPRHAANPANALLNYLYAILEAETRIALLAVGLDPGLGLFHTDLLSRDSLACDVMEAVRPQVDTWLLSFIQSRSFVARDFFERLDGSVRLTSQLTPVLAETAPQWARAVAPSAEWVAQELHRRKASTVLPTPLTQANRSAGRAKTRSKLSKRAAPRMTMPSGNCKECGQPLDEPGRQFCSDKCWKAYNEKVVVPRLSSLGPAVLAALRAKGEDPSHGGEVGRKRGQTNARRASERAKWKANHHNEAAERRQFTKEILPELANVPLSRIVKATGLSLRYASMIRRGLHTPHPMHNEALMRLIGAEQKPEKAN